MGIQLQFMHRIVLRFNKVNIVTQQASEKKPSKAETKVAETGKPTLTDDFQPSISSDEIERKAKAMKDRVYKKAAVFFTNPGELTVFLDKLPEEVRFSLAPEVETFLLDVCRHLIIHEPHIDLANLIYIPKKVHSGLNNGDLLLPTLRGAILNRMASFYGEVVEGVFKPSGMDESQKPAFYEEKKLNLVGAIKGLVNASIAHYKDHPEDHPDFKAPQQSREVVILPAHDPRVEIEREKARLQRAKFSITQPLKSFWTAMLAQGTDSVWYQSVVAKMMDVEDGSDALIFQALCLLAKDGSKIVRRNEKGKPIKFVTKPWTSDEVALELERVLEAVCQQANEAPGATKEWHPEELRAQLTSCYGLVEAFENVCLAAFTAKSSKQKLWQHKKLMPQMLAAIVTDFNACGREIDKFNAQRCVNISLLPIIEAHEASKISKINSHLPASAERDAIVIKTFADKSVARLRQLPLYRTLDERISPEKLADLQNFIETVVRAYASLEKPQNIANKGNAYIDSLITLAIETVAKEDFSFDKYPVEQWITNVYKKHKVNGSYPTSSSITNAKRKKGIEQMLQSNPWESATDRDPLSVFEIKYFATPLLYAVSKELAGFPNFIALDTQTADVQAILINAIKQSVRGARLDGRAVTEAEHLEAIERSKALNLAKTQEIAGEVSERLAAQGRENIRQFIGRGVDAYAPLFLMPHQQLLLQDHFGGRDDLEVRPDLRTHGVATMMAFDSHPHGLSSSMETFTLPLDGFLPHHIDNVNTKHVFFPLGDNIHWRAVDIDLESYREDPSNKIVINVFDSYGAANVHRGVEQILRLLLQNCGVPAEKIHFNRIDTHAITDPQKRNDGHTCGYYATAFFHWQLAQLEARRVPIDTRDDSYEAPYHQDIVDVFATGAEHQPIRAEAIKEVLRARSRAHYITQLGEAEVTRLEEVAKATKPTPKKPTKGTSPQKPGSTNSDASKKHEPPTDLASEEGKAPAKEEARETTTPSRLEQTIATLSLPLQAKLTFLPEDIQAKFVSLEKMGEGIHILLDKLVAVSPSDAAAQQSVFLSLQRLVAVYENNIQILESSFADLPELDKAEEERLLSPYKDKLASYQVKLQLKAEEFAKIAKREIEADPLANQPPFEAGQQDAVSNFMILDDELSVEETEKFDRISIAYQKQVERIQKDMLHSFSSQSLKDKSREKLEAIQSAITSINEKTVFQLWKNIHPEHAAVKSLSDAAKIPGMNDELEAINKGIKENPLRVKNILAAIDDPTSELNQAFNMKRKQFFGFSFTLFSGQSWGNIINGESAMLKEIQNAALPPKISM